MFNAGADTYKLDNYEVEDDCKKQKGGFNFNYLLVFSYKVGKLTFDNKDLKEVPLDELRD